MLYAAFEQLSLFVNDHDQSLCWHKNLGKETQKRFARKDSRFNSVPHQFDNMPPKKKQPTRKPNILEEVERDEEEAQSDPTDEDRPEETPNEIAEDDITARNEHFPRYYYNGGVWHNFVLFRNQLQNHEAALAGTRNRLPDLIRHQIQLLEAGD